METAHWLENWSHCCHSHLTFRDGYVNQECWSMVMNFSSLLEKFIIPICADDHFLASSLDVKLDELLISGVVIHWLVNTRLCMMWRWFFSLCLVETKSCSWEYDTRTTSTVYSAVIPVFNNYYIAKLHTVYLKLYIYSGVESLRERNSHSASSSILC